MNLMENFKDIYFDFFINNYKENLVKIWVYKDSTYVVDLYFEGFNIAFDLQLINNLFVVDRVVRNYENNTIFQEKKLTLIKSSNTSEIIEFLGGYLAEIRDSVNNLYAYKISVIIPVYNREALISKCIESLNNQNLNKSDFEVIFVDDYSSDKSIEAIETKVSKDIHYRILKRPINSGSASAPRNDGILAAKGKYLFFVDSDDYIFEYALSDMIDMAEKNHSDLVYIRYTGDKGRTWGKRPFSKGDINVAKYDQQHLVRSLMCSKLVRTSLLKNNSIYFPLDIKIGEDRVYMMNVLTKANIISILGNNNYYYITNHDDDKITNNRSNLEHDFEVVSKVFKLIHNSKKDNLTKKKIFSCWMNVVIESYIFAKLKSKSHSIDRKKDYFDRVLKEFNLYKGMYDSKFIYPEFIEKCNLFLNSDFNNCLNLSLSK